MRATHPLAATGVALTALFALQAAPSRAAACSCVGRTPQAYVRQADLVFLARAGAERRQGKGTVQPLEVLHALKGEPGRVYRLARPAGSVSTCDLQLKASEVALVFISKGAASICGGNYDLEAVQLEKMADYFRAGATPAGAPGLEGLRAALEAALQGYLRDRPTVPVTYAPLAGRRVRTGKTTLVLGKNRLKHAVDLRQAVTSGPLIFVDGFYGMEGYAFRALLRRRAGPGGKPLYETLARWGKERSSSSPTPNIGPKR